MYERLDWTHRGDYILARHNVTPDQADEAVADPQRLLIDPDYNSITGLSVRIIGICPSLGEILTVIALRSGEIDYGVNAWFANSKDKTLYNSTEDSL